MPWRIYSVSERIYAELDKGREGKCCGAWIVVGMLYDFTNLLPTEFAFAKPIVSS
jgi:hypothetical protein